MTLNLAYAYGCSSFFRNTHGNDIFDKWTGKGIRKNKIHCLGEQLKTATIHERTTANWLGHCYMAL